jgi:hypothetical protein
MVVPPLNDRDDIVAPDEEDPELRTPMNERPLALLEEDRFTRAGHASAGTCGERASLN